MHSRTTAACDDMCGSMWKQHARWTHFFAGNHAQSIPMDPFSAQRWTHFTQAKRPIRNVKGLVLGCNFVVLPFCCFFFFGHPNQPRLSSNQVLESLLALISELFTCRTGGVGKQISCVEWVRLEVIGHAVAPFIIPPRTTPVRSWWCVDSVNRNEWKLKTQ